MAKTCIGCGELRLAEDFPRTGRSRSHDPRCKACANLRHKNWYAKTQGQAWRQRVDWSRLVALTCRSCGHLTDRDALVFQSWQCRACCLASLRERSPAFPSARERTRQGQERNIRSGKWAVFPKGRIVIAKSCQDCGTLVSGSGLRRTKTGSTTAYCHRCSAANWHRLLQQGAGRNALRKDAAVPAPRRGFIWTGPELEQVARRDLPVREIARMLGRTVPAVRQQRLLLNRGEPRQVYLAGLQREEMGSLQ